MRKITRDDCQKMLQDSSELSEGWCGAAALPPTEQALRGARALLDLLPEDNLPLIGPLTDGSLQLEWHYIDHVVITRVGADGTVASPKTVFFHDGQAKELDAAAIVA